MARTRRGEAPVSNALVASAARIRGGGSLSNLSRVTRGTEWHSRAWHFYHTIGEFRYACDWQGAMLSKAYLVATRKNADGVVETVKEGPAHDYLEQLFGDDDGRAEALRMIGIHLSVTGKLHILTYADPDPFGDGEDVWEIVSSTRLTVPSTNSDTDYYVVNGVRLLVPPSEVLHIEIWRPDPDDPSISIAPAQAVLPILGEIERLTDHVAAQVDSRLAGAGIVLFPSEITFPAPPVAEGAIQRTANTAEDLMKVITTAMSTAIQNRSDPSALVPIIITAPGDVIDKVQHLTFWTQLDEHAIELRTEAIRRLALGMDIPPEVLQGAGDSNHWAAWQSDESAIKAHTEPLLKIITSALARGYLRPLLNDDGLEGAELRSYSIGADTSDMRLRPNRSKEALELHALGALSDKALRRECGFDEADAMSDEEKAVWLTQKVASGSTTPELVQAALSKMGVALDIVVDDSDGKTQEARPTPSTKDHPVRDIPDQEVSEARKDARQRGNVPSADIARRASMDESANRLAAALAVGSEQAVFRALERAGNRMRSRLGGKIEGISAAETYLTFGIQASDLDYYLEDAWGTNIYALAQHSGFTAEQLKGALDGYCRVLLTTQKPHTFKALEAHLTMSLRSVERVKV